MEYQKRLIPLLLLTLLMILSGTAALAAGPAPQTSQTVAEIAAEDGRFDTLVTALEAANLVETLNGAGPFTVFAPTDDAFDALPEGALDDLLADPAALSEVLLYHVLPERVTAADAANLDAANTAGGETVAISLDENVVTLNQEAEVIIADIEGANGIIHAIDAVLLPGSSTNTETEAPANEEEAAVDAPADSEGESPDALPVTGHSSLSTPNNPMLSLSILGLMVIAGGATLYARRIKRLG